jgi:hypothetical protein
MNDHFKDNNNNSTGLTNTIITQIDNKTNVEVSNEKNQLLNQLIDLINSNEYLNITFKLNFISNIDLSNSSATSYYSTRLPCNLVDKLFEDYKHENSSDYFTAIRRLTNLYKNYFFELLHDFKSIFLFCLIFSILSYIFQF